MALVAVALAGHYSVPEDAKIHKFMFDGHKFDPVYNITCNRDDRLQFWWNYPTKRRRSEEGTWFIVENFDKMKIYMEFSDGRQTDDKGLTGDIYELLNKRALMDSMDLINDMDGDNHQEMRSEENPDSDKKKLRLFLSQLHCYKVTDGPSQIIYAKAITNNLPEVK